MTVPFNSIYHATKWTIEGWSESMAFELNQFGIGMKTISPGGMKTDFFTSSFDTCRHPAYDKLLDKVMSIITDPKQMETYSRRWCTKLRPTEKISFAISQAQMQKQRMPCVCRWETKRSERG